MLNIHSNGSKWLGEEPDTLDQLLELLASTPLDPTFENYGNFVIVNPKSYRDGEPLYPDNPGTIGFFGNFFKTSHVFSIDTDDPKIIADLTTAIRANQSTEAYVEAARLRNERS